MWGEGRSLGSCGLRGIAQAADAPSACDGTVIVLTPSKPSTARLAWRGVPRGSLVALRRRLSPGLPLSRPSEVRGRDRRGHAGTQAPLVRRVDARDAPGVPSSAATRWTRRWRRRWRRVAATWTCSTAGPAHPTSEGMSERRGDASLRRRESTLLPSTGC